MVTLGGDDLVVELSSQVHSVGSPGFEVSSNIDRSAGAVVLADRPILLKGRRAIDGRLVGAGRLQDAVRAAIDGDRALQGRR